MRTLAPFKHVNWDPDAAELRRFAVSMLIGFAVLGLLAAWRHHAFGTTTFVLWAVGAALAVAAFVPGLGRAAYLAVYVASSAIGYVVSHVILFAIFFLIFTPIAFLLRLMGKDLLQLRVPAGQSLWVERPAPRGKDSYYRQF